MIQEPSQILTTPDETLGIIVTNQSAVASLCKFMEIKMYWAMDIN